MIVIIVLGKRLVKNFTRKRNRTAYSIREGFISRNVRRPGKKNPKTIYLDAIELDEISKKCFEKISVHRSSLV